VSLDTERRPPDARASGRDEPAPSVARRVLRTVGEVPVLVAIALLVALVIKSFLVQAFYIPSSSMEPTLRAGDRVLVSSIPYWFGEPELGDVVVFEDPTPGPAEDRGLVQGAMHWLLQGLGLEAPDDEDFIKRVIGVPGDVVTARKGAVYVNGVRLDEPYLEERTAPFERTVVPDDTLFVLGDNRSASDDSRFGLGFVPIDNVIGEAFMIAWPPSRMNSV